MTIALESPSVGSSPQWFVFLLTEPYLRIRMGSFNTEVNREPTVLFV
jgi:hypothetical protein